MERSRGKDSYNANNSPAVERNVLLPEVTEWEAQCSLEDTRPGVLVVQWSHFPRLTYHRKTKAGRAFKSSAHWDAKGKKNWKYSWLLTVVLDPGLRRQPLPHTHFPCRSPGLFSCFLSVCSGISGKSQLLFALVFTTRYLDLFTSFISLYNTSMKVWYGIWQSAFYP
jgi:hypothetical protein